MRDAENVTQQLPAGQTGMSFCAAKASAKPDATRAGPGFTLQADPSRFDRPHAASDAEKAAHAAFLEGFKDPIWNR